MAPSAVDIVAPAPVEIKQTKQAQQFKIYGEEHRETDAIGGLDLEAERGLKGHSGAKVCIYNKRIDLSM